MHEIFNCCGHWLVHHLEPRRNNARRNHTGNCVTGFAQVVKAGHDAARKLRLGNEFDRDFSGDGQHALTANHHTQQIETGRIQRRTAKLHFVAFNREAFYFQNVVHRQTILQAVHAA